MSSTSGSSPPTSSTYWIVYTIQVPAKASAKRPPDLNIISVHTNYASANNKIRKLADQKKPKDCNDQTHYSQTAKTPEGEPLRQRRIIGWQMAGYERDEGGGEESSAGVEIKEFVGGEMVVWENDG